MNHNALLSFAALPLSLFVAGCADTEGKAAPATLESQSLLALQRFYEDDAGEQIAALITLLDEQDETVPGGFYFDPLTPEDVDMFQHSDEAIWEHTAGCGVLAQVEGDMSEYVATVPQTDQSFPDPTYDLWEREVTGGDIEAFKAGEDDLETWNTIQKNYVIYTVNYSMDKDYRWHDDVLAMISLVPDGKFPAPDAVGLVVGFTIELWYVKDDSLVWYNASWTEIETPLDEEAQDTEKWLDILISGTLDYYWGTQEHATGIKREG